MDRADEADGPWSVNTVEVLSELDDVELSRLQDKDDVLEPIDAMLSEGRSPTLDELRTMPLQGRKLWSLRPTIFLQYARSGQEEWRYGPACRSTLSSTEVVLHVHAGPFASHLASQRTLAQLRQLYY